MSISSSFAAERSNAVKEDWQAELRKAYISRDWEKVYLILKKIETYQFSE